MTKWCGSRLGWNSQNRKKLPVSNVNPKARLSWKTRKIVSQ